MQQSDSSSQPSLPASGGGSQFTYSAEPPWIAALRIIVAGGGTAFLAATTTIPPWSALIAFILIAIPTHAGAVIDVVGRIVPNVNNRGRERAP